MAMKRLTVGKTRGSGFGTKRKIGRTGHTRKLRTHGSRGT